MYQNVGGLSIRSAYGLGANTDIRGETVRIVTGIVRASWSVRPANIVQLLNDSKAKEL